MLLKLLLKLLLKRVLDFQGNFSAIGSWTLFSTRLFWTSVLRQLKQKIEQSFGSTQEYQWPDQEFRKAKQRLDTIVETAA